MVFCIVLVLVLGYMVVMEIVGGVIVGYCVIGNLRIDNFLVSMMIMVIIYVNMGWLIKKLGMF